MSIRWWWAGADLLGVKYVGPDTDVRTGEDASINRVAGAAWENDYQTDVGGLLLGDGRRVLVIEGSPEALHAFLDHLRSTLPPDERTSE